MNRGSSWMPSPRNSELPRFNEAPIHESGKYDSGPWMAGFLAGFNEAPIHESGK